MQTAAQDVTSLMLGYETLKSSLQLIARSGKPYVLPDILLMKQNTSFSSNLNS